MAGSAMTFSYDNIGSIKRVLVDWTSDDTTGAVSGTTTKIIGELIKGVTDPGATAPTANYDIAITDEESFDVLTNCHDNLADRHTSNTEEVYFGLTLSTTNTGAFPVVADKLTIAVTNAGNSKQGQLILYYR